MEACRDKATNEGSKRPSGREKAGRAGEPPAILASGGLADNELLVETIAWLEKRKRDGRLDAAALSAHDAPEQFSYRLRWALALGVLAKEST